MTRARPIADDLIQPFQIEGLNLRGRLVRLGPAAETIISRHDYPAPLAELLGETLALAAVLAGALKYEGVFTLQTRSDGPVRMLLADLTSGGDLRGYAQYDEARLADALGGPVGGPVPRLLGAGHLAFTVDQRVEDDGPAPERYQGVVELSGASLAECAHHYFRQSEQLETGIVLAAAVDGAGWRAGALMVQRLPGDEASADAAEAAEDGWRRALTITGTARADELVDPALAPNDLLYRLFHEDGVRVFRPVRLRARCRCSLERVENMLKALPRAELAEMKVDGRVVVTCEFCGSIHAFDDARLDALFAA